MVTFERVGRDTGLSLRCGLILVVDTTSFQAFFRSECNIVWDLHREQGVSYFLGTTDDSEVINLGFEAFDLLDTNIATECSGNESRS